MRLDLTKIAKALGGTFIVTPSWVRVPADAYGTQLLAACDTLDADGEKAARKPSTRANR
jgi:hypothetical protein